jgi:hypothetical protein
MQIWALRWLSDQFDSLRIVLALSTSGTIRHSSILKYPPVSRDTSPNSRSQENVCFVYRAGYLRLSITHKFYYIKGEFLLYMSGYLNS